MSNGDLRISRLPPTSAVSDADVFPLTRNGDTVKAAMSVLKVYLFAVGQDVSGWSISDSTIDNSPIGGTTPASGAFTTLSASGTVSGAGFTARFSTPGPIGNTTPSTGAFTTLSATGGAWFGGSASPTSGQNVEATYGAIAGTGRVMSYDRTGVSRMPLVLDGSTVSLYYNGASKLSTSATGVDVTGNLTTTGNTTLGDASTDTVTVNGYMGVGGAAVNSTGAYITRTLSDLSCYGTQTVMQNNWTASGTYYGVGVGVTSYGNPGGDYLGFNNTGYLKGVASTTFLRNDTGTLTSLIGIQSDYGAYGQAGADVAGTITTARGFYSVPYNRASTTIGTLYDFCSSGCPAEGTIGTYYGLYLPTNTATGRWNIYASGTANNAFAGNVAIGSTTAPTNALDVTGAMTVSGNVTLGDASTDTVTVNGYMGIGGAASHDAGLIIKSAALTGAAQIGLFTQPTLNSSSTAAGLGIAIRVSTEAAAFTVASMYSLRLYDAIKGAGSTIANLHAIYITDQTQGTNNYGLTSLVSSGTNKWNIYASGTAANYFAGNVGIGTTSPTTRLQIGDATVNTGNILLFGKTVAAAQSTLPYICQVSEQSPGTSNDLMLFAGGSGAGRVLVNSNDFVVKTGGGTTPTGVEYFRVGADGRTGVGVVATARNNTTLQIKDGIGFPATQVASTDPNTLDDYEEGTWTPSFTNLTVVNGTGGATYSGTYTKIGRLVKWKIKVAVTGTCTTASTAGTTTVTLPDTAGTEDVCMGVSPSGSSYGVGYVTGATCYTPTWSASNSNKIISGTFEV